MVTQVISRLLLLTTRVCQTSSYMYFCAHVCREDKLLGVEFILCLRLLVVRMPQTFLVTHVPAQYLLGGNSDLNHTCQKVEFLFSDFAFKENKTPDHHCLFNALCLESIIELLVLQLYLFRLENLTFCSCRHCLQRYGHSYFLPQNCLYLPLHKWAEDVSCVIVMRLEHILSRALLCGNGTFPRAGVCVRALITQLHWPMGYVTLPATPLVGGRGLICKTLSNQEEVGALVSVPGRWPQC